MIAISGQKAKLIVPITQQVPKKVPLKRGPKKTKKNSKKRKNLS